MKFIQLTENKVRFFWFEKHAETVAVKLVADLFLFHKKVSYKIKVSEQHLSFNMFW